MRVTRMSTGVSLAAALLASVGLAAPAAAVSSGSSDAADVELRLLDPQIRESSGLTASTRHHDVLYTHNDSGGGPEVFALGPNGNTEAVLTLQGASVRDWEDIATGPDGSVWVGDIGDNPSARGTISVFEFQEPGQLHNQSVDATEYELRYPDGARDSEALLVRPNGRVLVVSKEGGNGSIYRAPRNLSESGVNQLERVGSAPATVTGGEFAKQGEHLVLRDYNRAFYYDTLGDQPRVIDLPHQQQGESIAFTADGSSLLSGSEGVHSPVHEVPLG